ncbi:VOC family protein [Pseudonocardia nematodicida]|uniref:VOC family protein n=1 Tax=Pseudonocardia nematodicida TaxID=1206997 RepID=A0ABV1KCQ9_9PSEU
MITSTTPLPSRPIVGMYSFRTADPRSLGAFWAALMDLPVSEHSTDDLVMLDFEHAVAPQTWLFQRDDAGPATHPRIGLDLGTEDPEHWRALADRAEELGAALRSDNELGGVRWIEMDDPDGNPFRVFGPRPA